MENEIELKIMLAPQNIEAILQWINRNQIISQEIETLGNVYYDTEDLFFAKHKMGLRVRNKNQQYELTLKTEGEIIGGLHIRPEYNISLNSSTPDLQQLITQHQLTMLANLGSLSPIFSTDFTRKKWLIKWQSAIIEIALDEGEVKNKNGQEAIRELELELKQGELKTLISFLTKMPLEDGMYLSGLSKAQRGYLIGNHAEIAKITEKITACNPLNFNYSEQYQHIQQIADFLRISPHQEALKMHINRYFPHKISIEELNSKAFLQKNIQMLKALLS